MILADDSTSEVRDPISPTVRERLERLRRLPHAVALARAAAPARVWLVGGALRDAAAGRATKDLDAVVERDAPDVAARLARELPARLVPLGGERFGALRLVAADGEIDLWDLRGGALAPDLERRDFTINAMALDLATGELLDPYRGMADLGRRRLRATRPTVFAEDPLRVLRLARFAATLGFTTEPATREASRAAAPGLRALPGERIRAELAALWERSPGYAAAQQALAASGAWPELWRPDDRTVEDSDTVPAARELDRRARSAGADERGARVPAGHAFCAHAAAGAEAAEVVADAFDRGVLSRPEADLARRLLRLAAEPAPATDADIAWFAHRAGTGFPLAFGLGAARAAATGAHAWHRAGSRAAELVAARGDAVLAPTALLDGGTIGARLRLAPGPELGRIVRRLREAQVRGEVGTEAEADRWLERMAAERPDVRPDRRSR